MLPILYRQKLRQQPQAFVLGGGAITFNIPRESVVDEIRIILYGVVNAAATGINIDGTPSMIASVTVRGSVAGGDELQPVAGLTGADLYELAQWQRGALPRVAGNLTTAGAIYRLDLPIYFREFFCSNELKNLLPAIPALNMSDLTVTIIPAALATVDSNSALTFTSCNIAVEVYQYYRATIPANMQFIRGTYEVTEDNGIVTSVQREVKLPSGGFYGFLGMRSYQAANVKQTDLGATAAAPITEPTVGGITLYDLSQFVKAKTSFQNLRDDNLMQIVDNLVAGNSAFLFNRTGEAGLFQTGDIGNALNNVVVQYDATAAANSRVRFVYRRLFDPANLLGL